MAQENFKLIAKHIKEVFDFEKGIIPTSAHITLMDEELLHFLAEMSDTERVLFTEAFFHFIFYLKAANLCRDANDIQEIWTNLILIILFGLIEKIMCEKNKHCYQYIKENIKKCTDMSETEKILEEWREKYGANRKIHKFFEDHTLEKEKRDIINALRDNPNFNRITECTNPIKKFIDWVINCRSKFVHELGLERVSEFNIEIYIEPDKNGELCSANTVWYPTINIDQLIHYVLLGVFRKFNRNNILTTIN